MRIERHNIDKISCITHDGRKLTTRDEIAIAEKEGRNWFGRMDIVLMNEKVKCDCGCPHFHEKTKQYLVYPGQNGTLTGAVYMLSPEDKVWAEQESAKVWQTALQNPWFMRSVFGVR